MPYLKLEKLTANFCQVSGEYTFSSGVTGIVGRNGKGKTNLSRAILTAITGKFSDTKEEDIPNGGDALYLNLQMFTGAHQIDIERKLKRSGSYRCSLLASNRSPDGTTEVIDKYTRISEVNDAVLQYLDTTKAILEGFVFPPQGRIDQLLYATPSERMRAFQNLIGVESMRKIEEYLTTKLGTFSYVSFEESIQLVQQQLAEKQAQVLEVSSDLKNITALRRDVTAEKNVLSNFEMVNEARLALKSFTADLAQKQTELEGVKSSQLQRQQERDSLGNPDANTYNRIQTRMAELSAGLRDVETYGTKNHQLAGLIKLETDIREKQQVHQEAGEPMLPSEPPQVEAARNTVGLNNKLLASLSSVPDKGAVPCTYGLKCPYSVEEVQGVRQTIEEARKQAKKVVDEFDAKLARVREEVRAWHKSSSDLQQLRSDVQNQIGILKVELGNLKPVSDPAKAAEELESLRVQQVELSTTLSRASTLDNLIAMDQKVIDRISNEISSIKGAIDANQRIVGQVDMEEFTADRLDSFRRLVCEQEELSSREIHCKSTLEILERDVVNAQKSLEDYKEKQLRLDKANRFCKFVDKARGVFNYKGLPMTVSAVCCQAVEAHLQHFLEVFGSPFTCSIRPDDLEFVVNKDGYTLPSHRLSGGEKVVLSMAYLLAVHKLFAGNIGLVVFDEPTVYLDDNNVDLLLNVFESLRELAKNTGSQIIVITHETRLEPCFDHVIHLE